MKDEYTGTAGENGCYYGYNGYEQTEEIPYIPKQEIDVNIQTMRTERQLFLQKQKLGIANEVEFSTTIRIKDPEFAMLNWKEYVDKKQTTRNILMYGQLDTRVGNYKLWGFVTWQEFSNHLTAADKQFAYTAMDEIRTHYHLQYESAYAFGMTYWLPKTEENKTCAGFYIIAVMDLVKKKRILFPIYNNEVTKAHEVSIIPINEIKLNIN